jgi:hypothetical protein
LHLEQLARSREQRGCNRPVEMGLAASLVGKGVNDREGRLTDRDCEPSDGVGLFLNEREGSRRNAASSSTFSAFAVRRTISPVVTIISSFFFREMRGLAAAAFVSERRLQQQLGSDRP